MHTKGPWILSDGGFAVMSPAPSTSICCAHESMTAGIDGHRVIRGKEALANARLIAAAPDLLEACKALDGFWLEQFEPPHDDPEQQEPRLLTKETLDVWRGIRAAIARATGAGA